MGKKRRGPTLDELLARPWCYYCERDFDDLKILISHQKAKHFKCERCGRRLNTAGGLSVHMSQVHKEQLSAVDNALPNRQSLDVEIFGMEGVPEDIIQSHNQRVTGNPPPGAGAGGQPAKRPKLENVSDLKKRLAEHKAKKAEAMTGGSSGDVTPVGAGQTQNAGAFSQSPSTAAPISQYTYPQPYGGAGSPYQQTASPVYQNFSPGGQSQFPPSAQYTPAGYSPQSFQGTPGQTGAAYGTPPPFPPQQPQQPTPQINTPPHAAAFAPRSGSLPAAPGLPQRPAVGAPQVNAYQLQQMHMGHPVPATGAPAAATNGEKLQEPKPHRSHHQAAASAAPPTEEKPTKKDKSKQSRLVYSDNETSPEEKMAKLPRYAFVPDRLGETAFQEQVPAAVTGTERGPDTVFDATD
ncbi:C2H2 finger domain protein [Aspergillus arachidicola]|uniref:C2H2 finger domain protein n=1 Tax=Aspergillus arachidicola TaxID=656916 RepID=A0A2G7G7U3_9EURO|nr:C2H2 finger domain protein [Aspergillus arachidicola]